jgi:hypothetical protein
MMSHRWMLGALISLLTVAAPAMAQEATPQSAPSTEAAPILEPQPASMPAVEAAQPVATASPAVETPAAEAAKPAAKEAPKRRFGYLAVFGMASLATGALSLILAGASLLNPVVILSGFNVIQNDTDGLALPGGRSVNPFYAVGALLLVTGLAFGAAGITMLGLEVYFNGSF